MTNSTNPTIWQRILQTLGFSGTGTTPADVPNRRAEQRFERSSLSALTEKIAIKMKMKAQVVQSEVFDLSLNGLCFRTEPALSFMRPGNTFDISVILGDKEYTVTVSIINKRGPYVGCRILNPSPAWLAGATSYLDPLQMGQNLYEIQPRFIQSQDPAANLHWFRSGPVCDFFYWSGPHNEVQKIQMVFAWQVVEWTPQRGFRTGQLTMPPIDKEEGNYPMSKVYDLQYPPDPKLVDAARRLVLAARVPESIRKIFE